MAVNHTGLIAIPILLLYGSPAPLIFDNMNNKITSELLYDLEKLIGE